MFFSGNAIRLVKLGPDQFVVISSDPKNTGKGCLRLAVRALTRLGASFETVEEALLDLEHHDHNVAEFGIINKDYLFTHFINLDAIKGAA